VAKRKLCGFCSFVQNNKEKSIEFFYGFSKKWQSFFEQKQVGCVLPFLCGFLEKKILFSGKKPKKQVILACKFKHYKVLLNRSKVCACYYYFYST